MRVTVATMKPPDRPLLPTSPSDIPSAAGEAHASRRALRMLSACNRALTRVDDEIALLSEICRIVVDIGGYLLAGVGYAMDDEEKSLRLMATAGDHPEHAAAMRLSWGEDSPYGQGPAGRAVRSGLPVAYTDFADATQPFPGREAALSMGYRSAISLPLNGPERTFGFLGLFSGEISRMSEDELQLLQELADNMAYGIAAMRARAEARRVAAELALAASHDATTRLPRWSSLAAVLEPRVAAGDDFVALLVVDIDRFRGINEAVGHAAADAILATVAQRLRDVASDEAAVARFAADEFVLVCTGGDEAGAHAPAHGRRTLDLLLRAQAAKDEGKADGRDCVSVFGPRQMQAIEDRVTLGGRLRSAVRAGELELHYQVQTRADASTVVGFEALLRWQSPDLGPVSPVRFIPVAEALGLMPEIGAWVLRESCRQARAWLDDGHRDFRVSVNVSAQQLLRPGLSEAVLAALDEYALPATVLDLELTESSLMENIARAAEVLVRLKAVGVRLSLDDFGTGYSSLSYLKDLPLDKLKIDRSFVRALPDGDAEGTIARTIVALGHQLGLRVAAEGVETAAQADFLAMIGCDELQGFLMGRPEPATVAGARMAASPGVPR